MNNTLLPCPFCGGEVKIDMLDSENSRNVKIYSAVHCPKCHEWFFKGLSKEKTIAAWNRRAQPENEPLTLDELRQMDGEPVMVLSDITIMRMLQNSSLEYNVGTVKLHRHMYLDVYEDVIEYSGGTCSRLDDCGRNIVAYRFKPEGETQ